MKPNMKLPWRFVPWHIEEGSSAVRCLEGWIVCTTSSDDDAAFIVRACNSFDELVEALKQAREFVEAEAETRGEEDDSYCIRAVPLLAKICSALAKSRGETP